MPSYIVKSSPGEDWFVHWSTVVDAPVSMGGTRAELVARASQPRDVAPERFARAIANGSSAAWPDWPAVDQPYSWGDDEFIVMEVTVDGDRRDTESGCYLLPRANLREFVERVAHNRSDVGDLLRFEAENDVSPPTGSGGSGTTEPGRGKGVR